MPDSAVMRYLVVAVLACACGGGAKQPQTASTRGEPLDAKPDVSVEIVDGEGIPPGSGMITGTVTSVDGERMVALSTVATSPSFSGEQVALTNETGSFVHPRLPPGKYTMTYIYVRGRFVHHTEVIEGKVTRITIVKWHPGPVGELL
jgi:hypothetical protein